MALEHKREGWRPGGIGEFTNTGLSGYNFDDVWEEVTDCMIADRPFRLSELVGEITCIKHLARKGQVDIVREVLSGVEAQGNNAAKRLSRVFWVLPSLEGSYSR